MNKKTNNQYKKIKNQKYSKIKESKLYKIKIFVKIELMMSYKIKK
jgi:hypothetical protein